MNFLRKSVLTLLLLHPCFFSQGQTVIQQLTPQEVESRLAYVYGSDFLLQNPELIPAFGKVINQQIEYIESPLTAPEKYPLLSSVPLRNKLNPAVQGANFSNFNIPEFNPLVYNIEFFSDRRQVFRIDNTNYLMIVKPVITH